MKYFMVEESPIAHFFFGDTRMAWLWLIVRVYLGWEWLQAGWEKVTNPAGAWVGDQAGTALTGFLQGALKKTAASCPPAPAACHADVANWYASFINTFALPNAHFMSYLVAYGEILVGLALIIGFLVGISAFFGMFMNYNFMLAGSLSVNPVMFLLGLFLVLAWRIAGYWGADYYTLPLLRSNIRSRLR
jgi:thiosulfate dehydrogenase (quinone) large subunit